MQLQLTLPALLAGVMMMVGAPASTSVLYVIVMTPFAPTTTEVTALPVMVSATPIEALVVGQEFVDDAYSVTPALAAEARPRPSEARARLV